MNSPPKALLADSPPLKYRFLIAVLSPVFVLSVLYTAWKVRSKRFALQRLGYGYPTVDTDPLWVHCASVGEVTAALPLIERLKADYPQTPVLVSTTTATGAATIERQNWSGVQHVYLAIDTHRAIARMFAALNPAALIILETELWPNLINRAARQKIPVVIVNGRLSNKTLRAPDWFKAIYHQALSKLTAVMAKSDQDAFAYKTLGAAAEKVTTVGNLKFAALPVIHTDMQCDVKRPFWLAASTHEDEELQICSALLSTSDIPDELLVIAPRHPERSEKIQEALTRLNIKFSVRSKGQQVDAATQVYLADTLGEMRMWLSHAKLVFMGGSLVPVGGHNLLEPAAAGLPVISGPHLHNFQEEADLLHTSGALMQVSTAEQVVQQVVELLSQPERCKQLGDAGRHAVIDKADVLQKYMDALHPLIPIQ